MLGLKLIHISKIATWKNKFITEINKNFSLGSIMA